MIINGFHRAAAVLNEFRLEMLRPFPLESVDQLNPEAIATNCLPGFKEDHVRLELSYRKKALVALGNRQNIIHALEINQQSLGDDCTRVLMDFALGRELGQADSLNRALWKMELANWFDGLEELRAEIGIPPLSHAQVQAEKAMFYDVLWRASRRIEKSSPGNLKNAVNTIMEFLAHSSRSKQQAAWTINLQKALFARFFLEMSVSTSSAGMKFFPVFLDFARNDIFLNPPYQSLFIELITQLNWARTAEGSRDYILRFAAALQALNSGHEKAYNDIKELRAQLHAPIVLLLDLARSNRPINEHGFVGSERWNVDLEPSDVTDFQTLARRLCTAEDPFSGWLFDHFSPDLRTRVREEYRNGGRSAEMLDETQRIQREEAIFEFVKELNTLIAGPLFDPALCTSYKIRASTLRTMRKGVEHDRTPGVNRSLIEDIFSKEILSHSAKLLNDVPRHLLLDFCQQVEVLFRPIVFVINSPNQRCGLDYVSLKELRRELIGSRKTAVGKVISDKMEKTIVVETWRRESHPVYKKVITRRKKFYVHDERQEARKGDTVRIVETRPMSKTKHWRLDEVLLRAGSEHS